MKCINTDSNLDIEFSKLDVGDTFTCEDYDSFVNCSASGGGALYLVSGNVDVVDCNFLNCTVNREGGAIYFEDRGLNSDAVIFRVTDSFEITGEFQVDSGAEFSVIMQNCP